MIENLTQILNEPIAQKITEPCPLAVASGPVTVESFHTLSQEANAEWISAASGANFHDTVLGAGFLLEFYYYTAAIDQDYEVAEIQGNVLNGMYAEILQLSSTMVIRLGQNNFCSPTPVADDFTHTIAADTWYKFTVKAANVVTGGGNHSGDYEFYVNDALALTKTLTITQAASTAGLINVNMGYANSCGNFGLTPSGMKVGNLLLQGAGLDVIRYVGEVVPGKARINFETNAGTSTVDVSENLTFENSTDLL